MSEKRDLANVLNAFKTMIHIDDRMDLAYHILPEAIQRAMEAEEKLEQYRAVVEAAKVWRDAKAKKEEAFGALSKNYAEAKRKVALAEAWIEAESALEQALAEPEGVTP